MFKEKEQEMKEEHKPLFSLVKKTLYILQTSNKTNRNSPVKVEGYANQK